MAKKHNDSSEESETKGKRADRDSWMRSRNKKYKRKIARQYLRTGQLPSGLSDIKTLQAMATRPSKR